MKLKRLDAFDINFVDSAAARNFKLESSTGMGESRIYIGHDEEKYDKFFEFDNIECFITEKKDLIKYLEDAYEEFMFPSQNYRSDITSMYNNLKRVTEEIPIEQLTYSFRKKFDDQHRYYIVLIPEGDNRKNYNYIRSIALPKVTKYCFIKFEDEETKKKYIYMRPIFFNDLIEKEIVNEIMINSSDTKDIQKNKKVKREKQGQYRAALLDIMPFCPFTMVTEDRLLVACHIKPFRKCDSDEERYDPKNGITMTPTYHVLFDLGFITFENDGTLKVSPFLSNVNKKRLHLNEISKIRLQSGCEKYLDYHRKNIYCSMPNIVLDDNKLYR